ncbi:MAG: PAS domain-containing protein [Nitrospirota bacterium]
MTRILVVDDQDEARYLLEALLTGHGYAVDAARHGAEALVKARQAAPDLVVSDLLMPVMDGYTLLRHWKADERLGRIPFVVYTATYTDAADERLALDLGADAFIVKPTEPEPLLARLEDVLALASRGAPARAPTDQDTARDDREVVIRTLEDKILQLQETNRALADELAARRHAELRLQARGYFLQQVLDAEPGVVYIYDLTTRSNVYVNRHWLTAYGYSEEETRALGGDLLARIFHPDDLTRLAAHHEAWCQVRDHAIWDIEYRVRTKAGEWRWLHSRETVFARDEAAQATQILGIAHDITERKQAEASLRETQRALMTLIENLPGTVYRCRNDKDWTTIFVSEGVRALTGYPAADFLDGKLQIGSLIHPDDQGPVWDAIQEALQANRPYQLTYRIRAASGEEKWVWEQGQGIVSPEGDLLFLEGFAADITDRKQAEDHMRATDTQLQALVANIPGAVYRCGYAPNWTIEFISEPILRISGYPASDFVHDAVRSYVSIIEPEDWPEVERVALDCLRRRQPYEIQYRIRHADGSQRWVHEKGQGVFDVNGELRWLDGVIIDITERKRIDEDLRASQASYATLVKNLSGAVYCCRNDANWTVDFISEGCESITGYRADELLHNRVTSLGALIHPDDAQGVWEKCQANLAAKRACSNEYRIGHRNGEIRWVWDQAQGIYSNQGDLVRIEGLITDITDRKRAEAALRENERRVDLALQGADLGTWDWNVRTGVVTFNQRWAAMLGYAPEDIEPHLRAWEALVHPEDMPRVQVSLRAHLDGATEGYESEHRMQHRSGRWIWVLDKGKVIERDADGRPIRACGTHLDVTARREAEESARSAQRWREDLITTIDGIVWEADATTFQFTFVSAQAERLLGYPIRRWIEEPGFWSNHVHPDDRDAAVAYCVSCTTLKQAHQFDYRMVAADGRIVWLHDLVTVIVENDRPVTLRGIMVDITARKEAEAAREGLEAQLRQAQKMEALGTLAGGIAHDFNNILGAIVGNLELARQDAAPDHPVQQSLAEINKATLRARDVVHQILTISRRQPQERRVLALREVVDETTKLLRATLPSGIELVASCASDTPNVLADRTQINQVLMNLCTNAWQAMAGTTGRISIDVAVVGVDRDGAVPPGRYTRLRVADTGNGMDQATLDRIFEPFFTTKGVGEGTGLGLAVVDGIVKGHDGVIRVSSTPGIGTVFDLYFPAVEGAAEAHGVVASELQRGRGQRILYLDDEEALVHLATRLLGRMGYSVTGCTDAAEALETFHADPAAFDLVVTDLNMPGVSGVDVAAQMLRERPELPIALTSGYVTEDLRAQALTLGIREVIYKPNTVADLVTALARMLSEAPKRG